MISVVILTRNEQLDLPGCLASVAWSDDVHVFDSYSTDNTIEIARAAGATVHQRVFDNYAAHRNASLQLTFTYPWLLILDADERPTPELCLEMQAAVRRASTDIGGFRIRRRDFLFNTWLEHAQISPFYIRLVRPERSRYTRAVNEVIEVTGKVGELSQPLDHFPFSKGMAHWIAKHNTYSTMEAELIASEQSLQNSSLTPSWKTALLDPDFHTRRRHQKALFYRMPGRPLLKWLYMVAVRRSFLDGWPGLTYATLQAIYEYFIVLKTRELLRHSARNQ
ncbi:glycosyl transferase, family 2 [Acidisarcina polymorpha]|uniref:Glycosyl transferase, family 2 n=1 Tax=Acidisarcina polymorpha TaxID=2211140 RepID=A0A2Z5G242_9BACT|nr:glycosyltransferase family 2 protein [Acidisarcina polymorpha]AXC13142.1 glycosyl transferase, family 2 [Acidisarcina polymorpha]